MDSVRTKKNVIKEWCERNMAPHTDWTGTRIETKEKCDSLDKFIDRLWEYIEDNHCGC